MLRFSLFEKSGVRPKNQMSYRSVCKTYFYYCLIFWFYFVCIRQHDVNILMLWVSEDVRDDCVLRFSLFLFWYLHEQNFNHIVEAAFIVASMVFIVLFFCCCGIRKHDVNILTQLEAHSVMRWLCAPFFFYFLFFFLLLFWSFPSVKQSF